MTAVVNAHAEGTLETDAALAVASPRDRNAEYLDPLYRSVLIEKRAATDGIREAFGSGAFQETCSQQQESPMAIVNALAGIMVNDLIAAEAWYEQLLARPADSRPMEGLAEWKLANGGWIQVFQDKDRAGSSSVTFLVSRLDDQVADLKAKGVSIERTTASDSVKTATVSDPSGNRVVFAELAAEP